MFRDKDKKVIMYGFREFCTENLQILPSTIATYTKVLNAYLTECIIGQIEQQDYIAFFDEQRLSKVTIKGNGVRPTLVILLDYFLKKGFITDEITYLQLKDTIATIFKTEHNKDAKKNTQFLTPNEIKNLFSDKVVYRTTEEKIISPLIIALSFFCLYRQNDISKLTMKDVDMHNRTIRNIRHREGSNLVESIKMNDKFYEIMKSYLEYRDSLHKDSQNLIIYNNKPIENPGMNAMFGMFKRKENKDLVNSKAVHCEILIRSMIFYTLESTNGQGISNILLIQNKNTFFEDAFTNYIEIKRNEFNAESIRMNNIDDLLFDNSLESNFEQPSIDYQNDGENEEDITQHIDNIEIVNYSVANDINLDDLEDFTMENNRQHTQTKVTIQRLVRDSNIARKLKTLYNNECQLCGYSVRKSDGQYMSEAHHIQPYNKLHKGDDTNRNIIVLCPNCHAQFDDCYFAIHPKTKEVHCIFEKDEPYHKTSLNLIHQLDTKYLDYAWNMFNEKKKSLENRNILV